MKIFMNVYLDLLKAENLWDYALGYEKIPKDFEKIGNLSREMFTAVRDFGKICSLPFLDYAVTTPYHRPLEEDFIKVYNSMFYAIIYSIKNLSNNQTTLSLSNIVLIAKKYVNNDEKICHLIDQIFTPNYTKPFNSQAELLNDETKIQKIVKNYVVSLLQYYEKNHISLDSLSEYVLSSKKELDGDKKSR